jgi:predicted flavoprotein YhiN
MSVVVVGAGASGMFAAITAARSGVKKVVLLESSRKILRKVLLSGGGRCNVMHQEVPLRALTSNYPRGNRELIGPMSGKGFSQTSTREWFEAEGVELKTEADGRVFPVTDDAETIAGALRRAAEEAGVRLEVGMEVLSVTRSEAEVDGEHAGPSTKGNDSTTGHHPPGSSFQVHVRRKGDDVTDAREEVLECSSVVLATGSAPRGYAISERCGHTTNGPFPSLFSFRKGPSCLDGLAGVTLPDVALGLVNSPAGTDDDNDDDEHSTPSSPDDSKLPKRLKRSRVAITHQQRGPLLVTHRGVSGPCALRLSAFAAEQLKRCAYRGSLLINLLPTITNPTDDGLSDSSGNSPTLASQCFRGNGKDAVLKVLEVHRREHAGTSVLVSGATTARRARRPFHSLIPRRLWNAVANSVINSRVTPPSGPLTSEVSNEKILWNDVSKATLRALAQNLCALELPFSGKDTNKEEFVTGGGVTLKEINLKKMESK